MRGGSGSSLAWSGGRVSRRTRPPQGTNEILRALIEHGKTIIERQFLHERMANAAMDIYLAVAVLSRATAAIAQAGSPEGAALDLENARIFVPMAMRRARRCIRALGRNQDARLKGIAERAVESGELTLGTPTDA